MKNICFIYYIIALILLPPVNAESLSDKLLIAPIIDENAKPDIGEKIYSKELDVYASESHYEKVQDKTIESMQEPPVLTIKDISNLELNLGPKFKKYDLSGLGFNAKVDYSMGLFTSIDYTFSPKERYWKVFFNGAFSSTTLSDLNLLTPNNVLLQEMRIFAGFDYSINSFSLGPILGYEKMSATQTTPYLMREDVDFFNIGLKGKYGLHLNDKYECIFETIYLTDVINMPKSASMGLVSQRDSFSFSGKVLQVINKNVKISFGVSFTLTETNYLNSSARGTSQAVEKEEDLSIPFGMSYTF